MHVHDVMYEAWDQPGKATSTSTRNWWRLFLLRVARDGRIDGVRLAHSSGNQLMDDSAVAGGARCAAPGSAARKGLGGDFAEISVNFRLEG